MYRDPETFRECSLVPPSLRTRRLNLVPLAPAHAADMAVLANNPLIARNLARLPHPYGLKDAEAFVAEPEPPGGARRALILTGSDGTQRFAGVAGIEPHDGRAAELGYWLGEEYWGKGLATEAAQAMVDFGFTRLGHNRISARCRVTNAASRRVIEKCGFQYLGQDLATTPCVGMVAVERFVLSRATWDGLRRWAAADMGDSA